MPRAFSDYLENTGDTDLIYLEMFKADQYQALSLSDRIAHTAPELVMAHLNLSAETLRKIPKD